MTKIKYNQRPFIYRSREDIDAFLEESQLWRDIYEVFLRVKDNAYYLKVPSVKMFNEVRYQCVRLMLDKHPEENVYGNYLNDARDTLGWRYASDLCFSMVYAVLSLLKNPPIQMPRFCAILRDNKLKTEQCYFPDFKQFVEEQKAKGAEYEIDLQPMPELPKAMRNAGYEGQTVMNGVAVNSWFPTYGSDWWKGVTKDFDQETIREVVALWQDKDERLEVVQMIEQAFDLEEQESTQSADADDLPF